jgi:hypothetical protein
MSTIMYVICMYVVYYAYGMYAYTHIHARLHLHKSADFPLCELIITCLNRSTGVGLPRHDLGEGVGGTLAVEQAHLILQASVQVPGSIQPYRACSGLGCVGVSDTCMYVYVCMCIHALYCVHVRTYARMYVCKVNNVCAHSKMSLCMHMLSIYIGL